MADIGDLMRRYGIQTAQGMARFVRSHLDELNADGDHAVKKGAGWELDETAVKRLDSIRKLRTDEVIQNIDNAEIKSLTVENRNLQTTLMNMQNELHLAQQRIIELQDETIKSLRERSDEESADKMQIAKLTERISQKDKRLNALETTNEQNQRQIESLKVLLEHERSRSWWDRLFNS